MSLLLSLLLGGVTVQTLDGHDFEIENFDERRATVVLFMAARCPITAEMMPIINEIYERNRLKEVLFVGIVANDVESKEEIRDFCQSHGVRFPVYRDPGAQRAAQWGATTTPEAFVFSPAGERVAHGGFHDEATATAMGIELDRLAAGKAVQHASFAVGGTPIDEAGTPRVFDNPYGSIYFAAQPIFERIAHAPAHHCSTITQVPNGDLLCLWYGGSYESSDDQVLFLARRAADAATWSEPEVVVAGEPLRPPGNALVFTVGDRVGILWGRMDASRPIRRGSGWSQCQMMQRYSDDNGVTWTEDTVLPGLFGSLPRNAPIALKDGRFAVPLSGERNEKSGSFVLFTSDGGRTWDSSGIIARGSQPTIVQRNDSSILAYMRSEPFILQAESTDGGETWSDVTSTKVPCPGAGIAMRRLTSGTLVLVHNDSTTDRTPLSIRYSTDEGATWSDGLDLVSTPGEYSYPCIVQTRDGRIHVTYTYRRYTIMHVEMNEDWLYHTERPN